MTDFEMWNAFILDRPAQGGAAYAAWQYGSDDPDALVALTRAGTKTATASAFPVYEHEGEPLPAPGSFSVILNTRGEAECIIQTTCVCVVPFSDVGPRHAFLEGEGDRSLAFWRAVHAEVFAAELADIGQVFTERMPVVLEEFQVVYPESGE